MAEKDGEIGALAPGLYLVATPIGNLKDITLRAIDVLKAADTIACEDTRVTGRLLDAYGIDTPRTPYHEHNARRVRPKLLSRLAEGARIALVSDAGTPLISDPGYRLTAACHEKGIPVTAIPGASASLTALVSSGLPTDRFQFAGFLPARREARRTALADLKTVGATLVLFESARRLESFLQDAAAVLGPRPAAVCRELTKRHEETTRGTLCELAEIYTGKPPPKGEIVIVIGAPESAPGDDVTGAELDAQLSAALRGNSLRDAVDAVSEATGLPRRQIYSRALALLGRDGEG